MPQSERRGKVGIGSECFFLKSALNIVRSENECGADEHVMGGGGGGGG
jgi:hypothetical protein